MWCGSCKDKTDDVNPIEKEVKARVSKATAQDEANIKMKLGKSATCSKCGKKKFSYVSKMPAVHDMPEVSELKDE